MRRDTSSFRSKNDYSILISEFRELTDMDVFGVIVRITVSCNYAIVELFGFGEKLSRIFNAVNVLKLN